MNKKRERTTTKFELGGGGGFLLDNFLGSMAEWGCISQDWSNYYGFAFSKEGLKSLYEVNG